MEPILTQDGAVTFYSERYNEWYHSKSGVLEEAREKYSIPCKISEKAKTGKLVILDFCFGIGYTAAVAIDIARETNQTCEITIIALENDIIILKKMLELTVAIKSYELLKQMMRGIIEHIEKRANPEHTVISMTHDHVTLTLFLGDAQNMIKQISPSSVDAVFFDPFSPKVCPELWTTEVFANVKKTMKENSILATYSCARTVRDNLRSAGFSVLDGPKLKRRGPSTIATFH